MLRSCKWLTHVSKSTTFTYKWVNRVGSLNVESMNNIFNLRDTEVDICIMLINERELLALTIV